METQNLYQTCRGFNPFSITVGGRRYQVDQFYLYNPDGSIFHHRLCGWFGSNNRLNHLAIPITIRRMAPKFDGATFIIGMGREKYAPKQALCALYIPVAWFDLQKTEQTRKEGFITIHTPIYTSSWEPEVRIADHSNRYNTEEATSKDRVVVLVAEKMKTLARLDELNAELVKLDPRGSVEQTARKAADRINGVKNGNS